MRDDNEPNEPTGRYNWRGQWVEDANPRGSRRGRLRLSNLRALLSGKRVAVIGGVIAVVLFLWTSVHIVPPGTRAIPVTLGRPGGSLGPGLRITLPFTVTRNVSVRTESYTMSAIKGEGAKSSDDSVTVLGRDGGSAKIDATVLFEVDAGRVEEVYRTVGSNYLEKIVRPSARSCIRSEFTNYDMVAAATSSWNEVETKVSDCMTSKLEPRGLVLEDFQLREVKLGDQIQKSIDGKVAAQQKAEQQRFELSTAQQAAEITRVQAMATADSQQILACGGEIATVERNGQQVQAIVPRAVDNCSQAQLTPEYLQFTYIQALKDLVQSPNASTIILPFDQNLTPLINLNGSSSPTISTPDSTSGSGTDSGSGSGSSSSSRSGSASGNSGG